MSPMPWCLLFPCQLCVSVWVGGWAGEGVGVGVFRFLLCYHERTSASLEASSWPQQRSKSASPAAITGAGPRLRCSQKTNLLVIEPGPSSKSPGVEVVFYSSPSLRFLLASILGRR